MRKLRSSYPTTDDLISNIWWGCFIFCIGLTIVPLLASAFRSGKCSSLLIIFGHAGRVVYRTSSPVEFWFSMGLEILGVSSSFCFGIWAPVGTILKYKARKAREKREEPASSLPKTD